MTDRVRQQGTGLDEATLLTRLREAFFTHIDEGDSDPITALGASTSFATPTNIRTTAADEKLVLAPPKQLTLEYALEFINDDELVEVTPASIRLRKSILDHNVRKRFEKKPSEADD